MNLVKISLIFAILLALAAPAFGQGDTPERHPIPPYAAPDSQPASFAHFRDCGPSEYQDYATSLMDSFYFGYDMLMETGHTEWVAADLLKFRRIGRYVIQQGIGNADITPTPFPACYQAMYLRDLAQMVWLDGLLLVTLAILGSDAAFDMAEPVTTSRDHMRELTPFYPHPQHD